MRLRALPPSFWQQPNLQPNVAPSSMCLPPLFTRLDMDSSSLDTADHVLLLDEAAPAKSDPGCNPRQVRISPANTDLLFKLFDQVDQAKKQHQLRAERVLAKPSQCKTLIKGEDPCIGVDSVAEVMFPFLRLDSRNSESVHAMLSAHGMSCSTPAISLNGSLSVVQIPEQNYSQALSDVVAGL